MKEISFWNEQWCRFTLPEIVEGEIYEVSNYGKVRHYDQTTGSWEILKSVNQYKDKSGFEYINNFKRKLHSKKRVTESVHRLVAMHFCKQPGPDHKYVIHRDYNKLNNYHENLEWVTRTELHQHNQHNPNVITARKKRLKNITYAKLTETEVIRLKKKLKRGKNPLYKIAKEFGITHTQLNRIRKGENWGHVKID